MEPRVPGRRSGSRLAVITGASRGLGAALSDAYRARGWEVVGLSRSGSGPDSVRVDFADAGEAARVLGALFARLAEREFDEIVAISNAAVLGPVGPLGEASAQDIGSHFEVNVVSAVLFCRAFVSAFAAHDGAKTLVNVSSGAASKGYAGWSLYCASKAAMENHFRCLALEQASAEHPVRAISVNPGVMDTEMQAEVRSASEEQFPALERFLRLQSEGRLAPPRDVADRIVELVDAGPEPGEVYSVSGA
jgi:NAD(P)-dependent dehydrogenase (short-subunit alcohol dehydrogenase family)